MKNDIFLRAVNKENTPRPPIWLMRQAGRYMAEYREMKTKYTFLEMCRSPELSYQVTMQPIKAFNLDAAILFSDILIFLEPMNIKVDFNPAPYIAKPIRDMNGVNSIKALDINSLKHVEKTIKMLKKDLDVPLIGFAGAPFTLAAYIVEGQGSKNFKEIKQLMHTDPKSYSILMELITEATIKYLEMQADSGADVLQLFDTWAGILTYDDYKENVFPYIKHIAEHFRGRVPVIYFPKDSLPYYPIIKELPVNAIGADWKTPLSVAANSLDNRFVIQGNLDPVMLFASKDKVLKETEKIVAEGRKCQQNGSGHIFNLGHGILPQTPVENVKAVIDYVTGL